MLTPSLVWNSNLQNRPYIYSVCPIFHNTSLALCKQPIPCPAQPHALLCTSFFSHRTHLLTQATRFTSNPFHQITHPTSHARSIPAYALSYRTYQPLIPLVLSFPMVTPPFNLTWHSSLAHKLALQLLHKREAECEKERKRELAFLLVTKFSKHFSSTLPLLFFC